MMKTLTGYRIYSILIVYPCNEVLTSAVQIKAKYHVRYNDKVLIA